MGWVWVNLGDVCEYIRGVTYNKSQSSSLPIEGYAPIFRANNIQNGKIIDDDLVFVQDDLIKKQQLLLKNDILVAMSSGSKSVVGKTAFISENINCSFGAFCGVLRPSSIINANLVSNFTQSLDYRNRISGLSAGANINNLKPAHFYEIKFPLPPKAEQDHIATLLDNHLSQVATISQKLNDILLIIKQFRQSVLAQAVSGKLTEDWRESNKRFSAKDEFELILQEKKSHSKKIEKHLVNEEFDIPKEWVWSSLDALTLRIVDGTHHTPTYTESGIPFISVKDIKNGLIDFSNTKFISEEEHLELSKRCNVEVGDLLITKSGTIGRTAIVKDSDYFSLFVSVALIKPISKNININFIDFVLQKWVNEIDVSNRIVGSAIKNLHLRDMKVLAIPFPPLAEQQQIVAEVERLFAVANSIETQVKEALERVGHLTQSILHQAFTGNLSADWRACNADLITGEHSATALLAQIKQAEPKSPRKKKAQ